MVRKFSKDLVVIFIIVSSSIAASSQEELNVNAIKFGSVSSEDHSRLKRSAADHVRQSVEGLQDDQDRSKRAPRGFLGLRGKKSPMEFTSQGHPRLEAYDFPTIEDYSSRFVDPLIGDERMASQLELIKKAPSGFLGMRGKKAPSGFLGMRGKKAPSAFLGLRGKKGHFDYEYLEEPDLQEIYEEKRTPKGFLGLRGKRNFRDGFLGLRG